MSWQRQVVGIAVTLLLVNAADDQVCTFQRGSRGKACFLLSLPRSVTRRNTCAPGRAHLANKVRMTMASPREAGDTEMMAGGDLLSAAEMQGLSIFTSVQELGGYLGGTGRAKLVWKSILEGKNPFDDEAVHKNTREQLQHKFEPLPEVVGKVRAADLTTKLLVRMQDGMEIESVIIPHDSRPTAQKSLSGQTAPRSTLCVSSQVFVASITYVMFTTIFVIFLLL
jgi:hypothetical protein